MDGINIRAVFALCFAAKRFFVFQQVTKQVTMGCHSDGLKSRKNLLHRSILTGEEILPDRFAVVRMTARELLLCWSLFFSEFLEKEY